MKLLFLLTLMFLIIQSVYSQVYFTKKQKDEILRKYKGKLSYEAMKIFEKYEKKSSVPSQPEMFNQILNYKGLYENLDISNVTYKIITRCHNQIHSLIGFDYKRYRNKHYLLCFSSKQFVIQTFRVDNKNLQIIFDENLPVQTQNVVQGTLWRIKMYHQHDTDQLFLAGLFSQGIKQIKIFEIVDVVKVVYRKSLPSFGIQDRIVDWNVIHSPNQNLIAVLIDSGHKQASHEFEVELDSELIKVKAQKALRLKTLKMHSQRFLIVANYTHWAAYRYQDQTIKLMNIFRMKNPIKDLQLFYNGHRYYVGIATYVEQYIYQWRDGKRGFQAEALLKNRRVYQMNALTISYSREDNFFYFDQYSSDLVLIYGYDITNSIFILLKKLSKSTDIGISPSLIFDPWYSASFYDHNFVYELKFSGSQIHLFIYETRLSNKDFGVKNSRSTLYNFNRFDKNFYEQKIEEMTRNVFKLDQHETISKQVSNLTFNFNVSFRGNVHVNHYETIDQPEKIRINTRDFAYDQLNISMEIVQRQIDNLNRRMNHLNRKLNYEVVYCDQNARISGFKGMMNKVSLKKIYARQAMLHTYQGRHVNDLLADLYRIGQDEYVKGRKTFMSDIKVNQELFVHTINGLYPDDFLFTDLEQDIYSNVWYRKQIYADEIFVKSSLSSNVSLSAVIFINGNNSNQPIRIKNKLVFDLMNVENLYTNTIDDVPISELPEKVLLRSGSSHQKIKIPTQIERIYTRSNISVHFINNHNVTDVFDNLILRDHPIRLDVPVNFMSDVDMNVVNIQGTINNVRIPEDLVDRKSQQIIFGVKRFSNVQVQNINVTYLNSLQIPVDIVTLSGDEEINTDLSFDRLKVHGNLQVEGLFDRINLTHLDQKFVDTYQDNFENLTFLEHVNVTRLTVKGPINDIYLDQIFSNAYFKNDLTLDVPSKKIINNVFTCQNIDSDSINGQTLKEYWTIKEPVIFSNRIKFENNIVFKDVQLKEKIDNIIVNNLLNEAVTLDSYQTLKGRKNFTDGIVISNHLNINGKINGNSPDDWMRYTTTQNINSSLRFTLPVECLTLNRFGNLLLDTLNGKNFTDQVSKMLFLDQPSSLNGFVKCVNCSADNLETSLINFKEFKNFLDNYFSKSKPQIITGQKNFISNQIFDEINSNEAIARIDFKSLKYNALTTDGYNIITNPVEIHGDLTLSRGKIQALKWNKINLESFNKEIVHRDVKEKIIIESDIIYQTDVDLMANIRVQKINQRVLENVLMTTTGNYTIHGDVRFKQNLIASANLNISGLINSANVTELDQNILKTNDQGELNSNGNFINFVDSFRTKEIVVEALVDNIPLRHDSIVMNYGDQNLKKLIIDGPQSFDGNINVMSRINNHEKDNLKKIVLVNSSDHQKIDVRKTFSKIVVREMYHEKGLLNINVINSINLVHFNSNVIYSDLNREVNTPSRFLDNVTINSPDFHVIGSVNGIRMADVVRLDRFRQKITGHKVFDSVVFNEDVDVHGLINKVNISELNDNVFRIYGNQYIGTPLTFIAPVFMMSNNSVEWLNKFHPNDLITIHGERIMNGNLEFSNIMIPKVYIKNHLINGINITDIDKYGFVLDDEDHTEQWFNGSLIANQAEFIQNVSLATHLNDLDLSEQVDSIAQKFDPNIDSKKISQELLQYQTMISHHRDYFELANFEIDYFDPLNLSVDEFWLEQEYFVQRLKIANISNDRLLIEYLYEHKNIISQLIKIKGISFIGEIRPNKDYDQINFRLSYFEQTTKHFATFFNYNFDSNIRPFIFSMDQSLHLVSVYPLNDCPQSYELELSRYEFDLKQLKVANYSVQKFSIGNLVKHGGHYQDQSKFHYVVFSSQTDDYDSQLVVYRRYDKNCKFRWFQTLPISDPIRQISLFTLNVAKISEPYIALKTDQNLFIWKQEGVHGFVKNWLIKLIDRKISNQTSILQQPSFLFPYINSTSNQFMIYVPSIGCDHGISSLHVYLAHFNQNLIPGTPIKLILNDYV